MTMDRPRLSLDIVSDTICPWCFIGKRRLEAALALRPEVLVEIRWRPYQLDPSIPEGGVDRGLYLERKFGAQRTDEIHARIRESGEAEGIAFAFDLIERTPNTLDSHRLIRWAGAADVQDGVVERLFRTYFEEGGDIGDHATLVGIAEDCGMSSPLVGDLLAGSSDRDEVRQEIEIAQKIGVTGVPCFIFADRLAVMGAQPPEVLAEAIDRALIEPATPGTG